MYTQSTIFSPNPCLLISSLFLLFFRTFPSIFERYSHAKFKKKFVMKNSFFERNVYKSVIFSYSIVNVWVFIVDMLTEGSMINFFSIDQNSPFFKDQTRALLVNIPSHDLVFDLLALGYRYFEFWKFLDSVPATWKWPISLFQIRVIGILHIYITRQYHHW